MKNKSKKLGVIVPYRNRRTHLQEFIPSISNYLNKQKIKHEIIIVEQSDDKAFNRGKLLNIGVQKALTLKCDYVALHDVDMLPLDVDYSYVNRPTHLATDFVSDEGEKRVIFDSYFGGVTLFPIVDYYKVNGYSNDYWGWGYEDDDILFRCKENFFDLNLKHQPIKTWNTAGLEFNGWDSEVKIPMPFSCDNYTILIECEPQHIDLRKELDMDEYSILSIPGYDTGFTFNSFKRFKFETFTTTKECLSLKSTIQKERRTTLIAVVDQYNKFIKLYQDGELIDEMEFEGRLLPYHKEKTMYLGRPGPNSENGRRFFKGIIHQVAFWNHSLEPGQVKAIYDNLYLGVSEQFDGYSNPHCLEFQYDAKCSTYHKLFDISGNDNHGKIHHCNRISTPHTEDYQEVTIPWRRKSKFKLLFHEDNGFYENKWIYTETRKNQIKFYNKVLNGKTNWRRDGVDTLRYTELSDNIMKYDIGKNKTVDVNYICTEL